LGVDVKNLSWLEYEGQTTAELMACKNTHRIDSLLCAFEWGIQAKAGPDGADTLSNEERLVLGVMALTREVNNGGYHQFFLNSSHRFAPIIVDSLRRIGCLTCADITARAIRAAKFDAAFPESILEEDHARDEVLDACDQEFYQLSDIEDKLFAFVEANQSRIQLNKRLPVPGAASQGKAVESDKTFRAPNCLQAEDYKSGGSAPVGVRCGEGKRDRGH